MAYNWNRLGAVAVVAMLGVGASVAQAQQQAGAGGQGARQACMADYKAMCSGVSPGGGRIIACLQQHAASLSPGCQSALAAAKAPQ